MALFSCCSAVPDTTAEEETQVTRIPALPSDYEVPKIWEYKDQGGTFGGTNRPYAGAWGEDKALQKGKHQIQLHSMATPNGVKVTIFLEELCDVLPNFDYDAFLLPINGAQFTSGFHAANPNSKIPAMLDYTDPAKPVRVFESGSILLYLADKFDKDGKFFPKEYPARAECQNWLMWQMGSAAFIGGGFGHFYHYAPVTGDLLAAASHQWIGGFVEGVIYGEAKEFLQVAQYKNLCAWCQRLAERPAVKRGRMVNKPWGDKSTQLYNRHSREDFNTKTQDKLEATK